MAPPASPRVPSRKPRRRYHHGDLRQALIDQALRTIRERGVEALTLRGVGHDLGVSRSALYRHFTDKAALLTAVATEGFRLLRVALEEAWTPDAPGPDGFERMGLTYIRFALDNPSHYRVMFGGFVHTKAADEDLARESSAAFQSLVGALMALQRAGRVRADDALMLARFVWAAVHGVAMLAIDGQLGPQPDGFDALARFAMRRIRTGIANAGVNR